MSFNSFSETLSFPLFGVRFVCDDTFAVSGGGGEGRHGIPNEVDVFQISDSSDTQQVDEKAESNHQQRLPEVLKHKKLLLLSKHQFAKNATDAPMSLELHLHNNVVYVGCNDAKGLIESNKENNSLKTFQCSKDYADIAPLGEFNLLNSLDPQSYIKKIKVSDTTIADPVMVLLTSDDESKFYVNHVSKLASTAPSKLTLQEAVEVKDFDLNYNSAGKLELAYISKLKASVLTFDTDLAALPSKSDPEANTKIIDMAKVLRKQKYQLLRIAYISHDAVLILGSIPDKKQIFSVVYSTVEARVVNFQIIATKVKSVNAVDCKPFRKTRNQSQALLAVATSDLSIILYHLGVAADNYRMTKLYEFKQVHAFAVTNLEISPELSYVVSTSAANTIHTITLPRDEDELIKLRSSVNYVQMLLVILVLLIALFFAQKK